MNVLLAEADVPYDKLLELEEANSLLSNTDVTIVVGANDVVNPLAETDPTSPIYGMPVIKVWDSKRTIVIKRSLSPGYAKIDNPLFYQDKNFMFFNDAKKALNFFKEFGIVNTLGNLPTIGFSSNPLSCKDFGNLYMSDEVFNELNN